MASKNMEGVYFGGRERLRERERQRERESHHNILIKLQDADTYPLPQPPDIVTHHLVIAMRCSV